MLFHLNQKLEKLQQKWMHVISDGCVCGFGSLVFRTLYKLSLQRRAELGNELNTSLD